MRILISAAEPSGDRIAAGFVQELQNHHDAEFIGVAGPRMRKVGVKPIAKMEEISVMGAFEVIAKIPKILSIRSKLRQEMHKGADLFLGVDAPDFHLPLLKEAKNMGIFSTGVVSPQIWAWRSGRAQSIAEKMDLLLCLFDFEPPMYPADFNARWMGHPAVDWIQKRQEPVPLKFGLAPGSRPQEIKRNWPVFRKTAEAIRKIEPKAQFVVVSPVKFKRPEGFVSGNSLNELRDTQAVLSKSGTVTLELALMGIPMVVAHKVHPLTHRLGRMLVKGTPFIALPNILNGGMVVKEHIQDLKPELLARELLNVRETEIDLRSVGDGGAIKKGVKEILSAMDSTQ